MPKKDFWRAIGLMALGMSLIPAGDAMAKIMMNMGVSPVFIAWARFAVGTIFVLFFLRRRHFPKHVFRDWRVYLRGVLIAATVATIITAAQTEDLATVFGAFFVAPILSYFFSALFLGERISWAQTLLLFIGFGGVLLVVKPGFGMTQGIALAVLAGCFYGCFLTASRWVSGVAPSEALLIIQLFTAALVLTPLGLPRIPDLGGTMPLWLLLSGIFSALGNLLLLFAYRAAPATLMAPFVYFQLIAATVLGFAIFGDLPDMLALLGLGLLVASGFASLALKRPA